MDMLENKKNLTLKDLNDYTVAWIEMEYNRSTHVDIKCAPIDRFSNGKFKTFLSIYDDNGDAMVPGESIRFNCTVKH